MSKTIVIFPYCQSLKTGQSSPKDYPYWTILVSYLKKEGYEVVQISLTGQDKIQGVDAVLYDLSLNKIKEFVAEHAVCYISGDSFAGHLLRFSPPKGIIIFAVSDPDIWGHKENINIFKSREFFRPMQYAEWRTSDFNIDAFPSVAQVMEAVKKLLS